MLKTSSPVSPFAVIPTVLFLIIAVMLSVGFSPLFAAGPMMIENPSTSTTTSTPGTGEDGNRSPPICDEWWSPSFGSLPNCQKQGDGSEGPSNAFSETKAADGTVIKTSTYVTGEKNIETKTPDGVISFEGYQKDGTRTRIIYLNNPGGERSDRFYENLKTGEANIELGNLAEEESMIGLKKIGTDVYSGKHAVFGTEIAVYRDNIPGKPSSGNWVSVTKDPGGNTTTVYRNNDGSFKIVSTDPNGFSTVTVDKNDKIYNNIVKKTTD
jgi:hypothetical protein